MVIVARGRSGTSGTVGQWLLHVNVGCIETAKNPLPPALRGVSNIFPSASGRSRDVPPSKPVAVEGRSEGYCSCRVSWCGPQPPVPLFRDLHPRKKDSINPHNSPQPTQESEVLRPPRSCGRFVQSPRGDRRGGPSGVGSCFRRHGGRGSDPETARSLHCIQADDSVCPLVRFCPAHARLCPLTERSQTLQRNFARATRRYTYFPVV